MTSPLRDAESATAGVPVVAYRTDIFESLPNGKLSRLILEADEVKDPDPDWTPLVPLSELDTARAEIERLGFELGAAKKIIAACAGALPNGAFIDPERASMDFMEMLPDEIHAVCAGMSDEIAKLQQDRRKVHELSATLRDKSTWNLPIQEAAQEIVLLSSQLPDPNAEPTNATLSPVKEPK